MSLTNALVTVVTIIVFLVILTSILSFFSIGISYYLIFLAWFIALVLFYYILPSKYDYFSN